MGAEMNKSNMLFNGFFVREKQEFYIFLCIVFILFVSKSGVLLPGLSIDDYAYALGGYQSYGLMFSQGRYMQAGMVWLLDVARVNANDLYVLFGILALLLQALFVLGVLRMVRWQSLPVAALAGALMASHPYVSEIFTFRMALSGYCLALLFSIVVLEAVRSTTQVDVRARAIGLAFIAMLGLLFTYQIFVNYLLVLALFLFMNGVVRNVSEGRSVFYVEDDYRKAFFILVLMLFSIFVFLAITKTAELMGFVKNSPRSAMISVGDVGHRLEQAWDVLQQIYWRDEPVFSVFYKRVALVAFVLSLIFVVVSSVSYGYLLAGGMLLFLVALLAPLSIGVILPFKEWWPVPRVIAHTSMIFGLMLLLADKCKVVRRMQWLRPIAYGLAGLAVFGFALMSNQIFSDQLKVNEWDRSLANRVVARLEQESGFQDVQFIHVQGGRWGYPVPIRSMQGDMNLSAFFPAWSKVNILSVVSGYMFKPAEPQMQAVGSAYCAKANKWPRQGSIFIEGNLAVVCFDE